MKVAELDFEQSTFSDLTVGCGFLLNMPWTRTGSLVINQSSPAKIRYMSMTSLQIYRYFFKASFVSLFSNQSAELPSATPLRPNHSKVKKDSRILQMVI
jgi:hypothetical protein